MNRHLKLLSVLIASFLVLGLSFAPKVSAEDILEDVEIISLEQSEKEVDAMSDSLNLPEKSEVADEEEAIHERLQELSEEAVSDENLDGVVRAKGTPSISKMKAAAPAKAPASGTTITNVTVRNSGNYTEYGAGSGFRTEKRWITHINGEAIDLDEVAGVSRCWIYCVEPWKNTPASGTYSVTVFDGSTSKNSKYWDMRKIAYYSPGGAGYGKKNSPSKKLYDAYPGDMGAYELAHCVLSWANDKYSSSSDAFNGLQPGGNAVQLMSNFVNQMQNWPDPPETYQCVLVEGGSKQDSFGSIYLEEYGMVKINKTSADASVTNGNANYSLANAEFTVYEDAACTKVAKFSNGDNAVIKTDENGKTDEFELLEGDYYVKETKAPKGYVLSTERKDLEINSGETTTVSFADKPMTIEIDINKVSANESITKDNNCYSLEGAKFEYKGAHGATGILTTDANGKAKKTGLPIDTYTLTETQASKGYAIVNVENISTVPEGNSVVTRTVKEIPKNDPVDIIVGKVDAETTKAYALNGATFINARFEVKYYDNTSKNTSGTPTRTWVFKTNEDGAALLRREGDSLLVSGDQLYLASDGKPTFPIGTYTIQEIAPPEGYLINNKIETVVVQDNEAGTGTKEYIEVYHEPSVPEQVMRGSLEFIKAGDDSGQRFANIPFIIRETKTGETHVVVTDKNGRIRSEKYTHSSKTNINDAILDSEGKPITDSQGFVDESKLDYTAGSWFGSDQHDNVAPVDDGKYALPYGTYLITELKVDRNKNYKMIENVQVVVDEDLEQYNLGTIDNQPTEPSIETDAKDAKTQDHVGTVEEKTTVIDTVMFSGLKSNENYQMIGTLMDKETEEPFLDKDGKEITAKKSFNSGEGSGTVELEFTFDSSLLAGKDLVAFESLMKNGKEVTVHTEITDERQTIHYPDLATQANRTANGETHKVTDTVALKNLVEGQEYTVKGTLMGKETSKAIKDKDGKDVTAEKKFTANAKDMEIELTFEFTSSDMIGKTGVVFEKLFHNDVEVATHEDIADEKQTVEWPNPKYNMYKVRNENAPAKTEGKYGFIWGETVTYTVVIENTGNCDLKMDVSDEFDNPELFTLPVVKSVEGATENSRSEDGNVVNITLEKGKTAKVVYSATIKDGVEEYLANAAKDSDSLDKDGNDVNRVDKDNNPDDKDGYINRAKTSKVQYKDDKDENPDNPWKDFPNGDKEDDAQTPVQKPEIGTTLADSAAKKEVNPSGKTELVDTVEYKGLNPNETYDVVGELIVKDTKDNLVENGEKVVAHGKFTPESSSGTTTVTFVVDTTGLVDKEVVAFETLYKITGLPDDKTDTPDKVKENGTKITEHKDINDEGQTIKVVRPEIRTTAKDSDTQNHISNADEEITIIDTVIYKDLVKGQEYEVKGVLMDKSTKKAVTVNGKEVTASATFTPDKASGSQDITFKFDGRDLAGKSLVAFEELYANGHLIAEHKDFNDKDQTVNVPKIGTTVGTPKDNKVEDTVKYENLIPGIEYTLKGYFVDKATGKKIEGTDGSLKFTPKSANGKVKVTLPLANAKSDVVAFEYLYVKNLEGKDIEVAKHTDRNDKSQTLIHKNGRTTPETGDQLPILPIGGFVVAASALVIVLRKRIAK